MEHKSNAGLQNNIKMNFLQSLSLMASCTACKYDFLMAEEIRIFKEMITQSVSKFWN